jgi:hypothetical protein
MKVPQESDINSIQEGQVRRNEEHRAKKRRKMREILKRKT